MNGDSDPEIRAAEAYRQEFGGEPELVVSAPGRVNLIGEHSDYNDGFVLPCAIDRRTAIAVGGADGDTVELLAADLDCARDKFSLSSEITPRSDAMWANYVRGVFAHGKKQGAERRGARLAIAGNLPQGAGLSSSASLCVATAHALDAMTPQPCRSLTELALLAQKAENDFAGMACGNMDQLASAHGEANKALLIDCRSLEIEKITFPEDWAILIVHSGIHRSLAETDFFNERRRQCEATAAHYGVTALRDLSEAILETERGDLDDTLYRRARHVVTEQARVHAFATAMRTSDIGGVASIFAESHASMRDDFEITLPVIDDLVAMIADTLDSEGGVRMTGAGLGGCIVAVLPASRIGEVEQHVLRTYRTPDGDAPWTMHGSPAAGVSQTAT